MPVALYLLLILLIVSNLIRRLPIFNTVLKLDKAHLMSDRSQHRKQKEVSMAKQISDR